MKPHITVASNYLNTLPSLKGIQSFEDPSEPDDFSHLKWMLEEIVKDGMSDTKANRWLGFVQGMLFTKFIISVEDERDSTRDIFDGL